MPATSTTLDRARLAVAAPRWRRALPATLRARRRQAHARSTLAFEHLARARAACRRDDRAAAPARRSARSRQPRRVHACASRASAPAPRARCWTTPSCRSCASSRATACSAAFARTPAPSTRSRWCRVSISTPERAAAARAERGGHLRLHRAAASRWAPKSSSARCSSKLAGHSMFAGAGRLERLQDVRRLPRHRPDDTSSPRIPQPMSTAGDRRDRGASLSAGR